MERLSHDLNLALEESNCGKQGRRKFGLRRRTRSTGNIPASCLVAGVTEDGSSSSPPQPPIISQVLSDSDDPQLNQLQQAASKTRSHFCPGGNIESDSFNENFSPTKPPTARRKRKFKKMAIDYADNNNGRISPSIMIGPSHVNMNYSVNVQGPSPLAIINKKKRIFKHGGQDGYIFSGKRKWSHREKSEVGEMRERSFSGGCTSKSYFFSKNSSKSYLEFKNSKKYLPIDKVPKFKEKLVAPAKSVAVKNGIESALQSISLSSIGKSVIPGSSSFNFVYRSPMTKNETPDLGKYSGIKIATELPPFFMASDSSTSWAHSSKVSKKHHDKGHNGKKASHHKSSQGQLRNPLQFDDSNIVMDCSIANELLSSSSLSSSDSEGVVTNDSDREGDDELTDWPGNEEISSFNKSLTLKVQRPSSNGSFKTNASYGTKPISKKDKFLPKQGLGSCKNKTEVQVQKTENITEAVTDMQLMDDDTMMSDSGSVLDTYACSVTRSHSDPLGPSIASQTSFTSFSEVKNAGLLNNNANEAFFHSFQEFQDKSNLSLNKEQFTPRTNFTLQKTSSSDLNLSEKSPQSDHCYSEHSICFGTPEIREIRAGCRRIREERPGFAILSSVNEQLSKFLQDSCQDELKLGCSNNDQEEKEKLASLAKLYSLELSVEMGRPILRKTSNTTQSVRVEHTRLRQQKFLSEFKRRCYGDDCSPLSSLPHHHIVTDLCKQHPTTMEPDLCVQSTSGVFKYPEEAYKSLAKAMTYENLSNSQDYDQGFSEPNMPDSSLGMGDVLKCHGDSEVAFLSDGTLRPDILANIPRCSKSSIQGLHISDSSSIELAELE